jgi:hypothetical protein
MTNHCFVIGVAALALAAGAITQVSCSSGSNGTGTGGTTGAAGTSGGHGGAAAGTTGTTGSGGTTGTAGRTGVAGTTGTAGTTGAGGTTGVAGTTGTGGTTGVAGHGGTTGTAGHGGATGTAGATGTGGTGVAPFFTDDFESDTAGQQPAGWDNYIAYNYKTTNPQGDGTGALADATHTRNNSKLAVHFKASGGNPVFLERPLPTGTNHLYLRVFVYLMTAMGDLPANPASGSPDNHETLLGLTGDPTMDGTQVRFGQIKGVIGTNLVPGDNIVPVMLQWYSGPVISAGTWHCIQVEFDGTASYNTLRAYSDGTLVNSITAATDWQNAPPPAGTWMNGMFVDVMLGWQSFSSMANEVWMDDLALSTGPIGCN